VPFLSDVLEDADLGVIVVVVADHDDVGPDALDPPVLRDGVRVEDEDGALGGRYIEERLAVPGHGQLARRRRLLGFEFRAVPLLVILFLIILFLGVLRKCARDRQGACRRDQKGSPHLSNSSRRRLSADDSKTGVILLPVMAEPGAACVYDDSAASELTAG